MIFFIIYYAITMILLLVYSLSNEVFYDEDKLFIFFYFSIAFLYLIPYIMILLLKLGGGMF